MLYPEQVKLVIWDLDETFWKGTLSEEGIELIQDNIALVKMLSERGIVNSICSKNDFDLAKAALIKAGVWEYFVFSRISWNAKGPQVKDIVETMGLRAENCIFIDDNHMNLNEVKDFVNGIFTYYPEDIIPKFKELNSFKGKDDKHLSRLGQYKILEDKYREKEVNNLSNEDFLKRSDIKIRFDFDVEKEFERIVEILNRTNQLNFTKVRIDTEEKRKKLLLQLNHYQSSAALVYCQDKYGDYGVIGFYLMKTSTELGKSLVHFAFSCRCLNMGVEQYVYNKLGKPNLKQVLPVASEIGANKEINWIQLVDEFSPGNSNAASNKNTLILGPCHLLQLSNFIESQFNYTHYQSKGGTIKFDCPGIFLTEKSIVENSSFIEKGFTWGKEEYIQLHNDLLQSDIVILSLDDILLNNRFYNIDGILFRGENVPNKYSEYSIEVSLAEKVRLVKNIIKRVANETPKDSKVFILNSVLSNDTPSELRVSRLAFMMLVKEIKNKKINFIDMNYLINENGSDDGIHLTRNGYYQLSKIIKNDTFVDDCQPFDYSILESLNIFSFKDRFKIKYNLIYSMAVKNKILYDFVKKVLRRKR